MADDAPIDLKYWAMPNETPEQANAHVELQKSAHKWWACHLEKEALDWIKSHGSHQEDIDAVEDHTRRAASSDYWE